MWELDHKEGWALKNWCFFELQCWGRLLRVLWTARRSNQSILKEISPEYSLEGLMLKLKLPIFWLPDVKNWLIGKDPDTGKDWRWEEKGTREDEIVGWHHWLNGHEFEQTPGVCDGQGGLVCCHPRGRKELVWLSDWTELRVHGATQSWMWLSNFHFQSCWKSRKLCPIWRDKIKPQKKKKLNEVKIGKILEKEFRIMIVKTNPGSQENNAEDARNVYQRPGQTKEQTNWDE